MARPDHRVRTTSASEARQGTTFPVRAGRGTPVEERLLEELRRVGRELIGEPVPQRLLNVLRVEDDRQD